MQKNSLLPIGVAVLAGFAGGALSQRLFSPETAYAQSVQAPRPPGHHAPADEVAANRLVLVDQDGKVYGLITMKDKSPEIDLFDKSGKLVWRAPANFGISPLRADH